MRPRRHVHRSNVRPTYARRPVAARRPVRRNWKVRLPLMQISWIRWGALGVIVLALVMTTARLTSVEQVRIQGNRLLPSQHLSQLAEEGLRHQWFGYNLILVNTSALASYIQQADAGIKQVSVERHWFHGLAITIQERQPTLNWKTGDTVYLLDADATVIGPTGGVYAQLPIVTDSSNLPVKAGDRVAPTSFVAFCSSLAKLLPSAGYQVASMTVPTTTSEVYVKTASGLVLKFDTTRPVGDEIADLQAVRTELDRAHKAPSQYIDLRVEHKAYYK